jgi:hypothetical protein
VNFALAFLFVALLAAKLILARRTRQMREYQQGLGYLARQLDSRSSPPE